MTPMPTGPLYWRIAALTIASLLSACALPPAAQRAQTEADLNYSAPARFAEADASPDAERQEPLSAWWKAFSASGLDAAIAQITQNNPALRQAQAKLAQARAQIAHAQAQSRPTADLRAGASSQGGPLVNAVGASGSLFTLAAGTTLDLDTSGRLNLATQAAQAQADMAERQLAHLLLELQAQATLAWLTADGARRQSALLEDTAQTSAEMTQITLSLFKSGLASEADWLRRQAEAAQAAAEALAPRKRQSAAMHELAMLGVTEPGIQIPQRGPPSAAAPMLPVVPPGIPAQVLRRRPDMHAALQGVRSAELQLGLAQAAWRPGITLTASGGQASEMLGNLLQPQALAWSLGASLVAPLFDGGRREAQQQAASASLDAARAQFVVQAKAALREVDDQLSALRTLAAQDQALASVETFSRERKRIAQNRLALGTVSRIEVLDTHREVLRAQLARERLRGEQLEASVGLVRALGGGW